MARAAWRPCGVRGCGALTRGGPCGRHVGHYDRARGSAAARGYGRAHRAWRVVVLARDPICAACGIEASVVADHIRQVSRGGGWELANGQGLCWSCHERKKAGERGGL